eukprot:1879219-Amphidinium_carterae.1
MPVPPELQLCILAQLIHVVIEVLLFKVTRTFKITQLLELTRIARPLKIHVRHQFPRDVRYPAWLWLEVTFFEFLRLATR